MKKSILLLAFSLFWGFVSAQQLAPISNTPMIPQEFTINYSFDNLFMLSYPIPKFEFDIKASVSGANYEFGEAVIYIEYDTLVLGTNIASNGKVMANKETIILSSDYSLNVTDENSHTLKVEIDAIPIPTNLFVLGATEERLCNVSVEISNILFYGTGFSFNQSAMQTLSKYFNLGQYYPYPYVSTLNQIYEINPCGTEDHYAQMVLEDPNLAILEENANQLVADSIANGYTATGGGVITIPVVFHVIYGDINGVENLPDNVLFSQITALNNAFRKQLPLYDGVDTEIQFCLAAVDPNGNPTTGITRHLEPNLTLFDSDTDEADLANFVYWDRTKYLNIYVCASVTDNLGGQFAYSPAFPWDNNPIIDGVIAPYMNVGSIGNHLLPNFTLGHIVVHEVGHYLGLYHPFHESCDATNDCVNEGDRVCDTPTSFDAITNCDIINQPFQFYCTDNSGIDIIPTPELLMDYRNDNCRTKFTQGQADRMHLMADTYRTTLIDVLNPALVNCIQNPNSIKGALNKELAQLYPNPVSNHLQVILSDKGNYILMLFNTTGKQILSLDISENHEINLTHLKQGLYFVKIQDEKGNYFTSKLIKQ